MTPLTLNCPICGKILDKLEEEREFVKKYCDVCKKDVIFELEKKYIGYVKKEQAEKTATKN